MSYREYKEGDTVRVTGCQGRLFCNYSSRRLNSGVSLGVECVLVGGEDPYHVVRLPRGILADDNTYLSVACIELVQAVEDKISSDIEKKPKPGYLEKLVDIPKTNDPNLFMNIPIPIELCVHENLTTPLTLAHLDKFELKLTKLESKLGGRIEKLFTTIIVIGAIALTTLFLLCMGIPK